MLCSFDVRDVICGRWTVLLNATRWTLIVTFSCFAQRVLVMRRAFRQQLADALVKIQHRWEVNHFCIIIYFVSGFYIDYNISINTLPSFLLQQPFLFSRCLVYRSVEDCLDF